MVVIERRFAINGVQKKRPYYVYTKDEAEEKGYDIVSWREAKPGEWALDDANYVSQCVARTVMPKTGNTEVKFPFARAFTNRKKPFGYGITQEKHWAEVEAGKTRTKRAVKAYVAAVMDHTITEEDERRLGKLYRHDQLKPIASWRRLLRQKPIQDMILAEMANILDRHGVTPDTVVEDLVVLKDKAVEDKQYNVARQVLDRFVDMLGMKQGLGETEHQTGVQVDWSQFTLPEEGTGTGVIGPNNTTQPEPIKTEISWETGIKVEKPDETHII